MVTVIGFTMTLFASFLLNLPLGIWRAKTKRFSPTWFASIHLAVPIIYLLRTSIGLSYWAIPFLVIAAVFGQLVGGRVIIIRRRRFLRTKREYLSSSRRRND